MKITHAAGAAHCAMTTCQCSPQTCESVYARAGGFDALQTDCDNNPYMERCETWCYDHISWSPINSTLNRLSYIGYSASAQHTQTGLRTGHQCSLAGPQRLLDALKAPVSSWVEDGHFCSNSSLSGFMCLGTLRWMPGRHHGNCGLFPKGKLEACAILARRNITEIHVVGDSLMRHFYLGLSLVMAEQYHIGVKPGCHVQDGFAEGACATSPVPATWCNGTVKGQFIDRRRYGGKMMPNLPER